MNSAVALQRPTAGAPPLQGATAGRRFYDAASASWMVKVFPGEYYTTMQLD